MLKWMLQSVSCFAQTTVKPKPPARALAIYYEVAMSLTCVHLWGLRVDQKYAAPSLNTEGAATRAYRILVPKDQHRAKQRSKPTVSRHVIYVGKSKRP
jgi:hypothetical protein